MKAQDMMDKDNERAKMVELLVQFCSDHDLSYTFNEKQFKISLPHVKPVSVLPKEVAATTKERKKFDIRNWGKKGIDEAELITEDEVNMPDELPPTTTPLDEGTPPEGDEEK